MEDTANVTTDDIGRMKGMKGEESAELEIDIRKYQSRQSSYNALKYFDGDGDDHISVTEIIRGAKDLKKSREENAKQKKLICFLLMGYIILIITIGGLVYGILKLTQETRIENGGTLMSNSKNSKPISTNTNQVSATLGMIPFLPPHVISKIDKFSVNNYETELYRIVQSIDVNPEESFVITSTAGDTLIWDSNINNEWMHITLADGITFKKHVGCSQCSVINFAQSDEIDEALDLFAEFLAIVGTDTRRFLEGTEGKYSIRSLERESCDDYNTSYVPPADDD